MSDYRYLSTDIVGPIKHVTLHNAWHTRKCKLVLAPDRRSGPKRNKITSGRSAHTPGVYKPRTGHTGCIAVQQYGAAPHRNLTCVARSADTEIVQHERRGPLDQVDP